MKYDLILIDGSSYLFRAYHALPPLVSSEGIPTGAIFGVLNMIKKLEKDYPDTKIIVVFDPKGGSFREELYPEYKASRDETPNDLVVQIPILQDIIVSMGLPLLVMPGYEADDVIATLVAMANEHNILISTLDKDLAQLVGEKVHIINTMHNKLLTPEKVFEKFQVHPHQIRDYLALVGDRSDNVPGITGVGPKTAAKWLGLYHTIAGIKENKHLLSGKVGQNFIQEMGQLDLSYQLVSLADDLDLGGDLDAIVGKPKQVEVLKDYFKRLGFNRWLADLSQKAEIRCIEVRSENLVKMILSNLEEVVYIGYRVDKNHNALKPIEQFTLYTGKLMYFISQSSVDVGSIWQQIMPKLEGKTLVSYDVKNLLNAFYLMGLAPQCNFFDVMLAGYVLDSSQAQRLEKMAMVYLDDGLLDNGEDLKESLSKDVMNVAKLYKKLALKDNNKVLFETLEMPIMHILAKMERDGILLDIPLLEDYAKTLKKEVSLIEKEVEDLLGKKINLASPKQLSVVLFEELGLPVIEKTKGGIASTGESVLQALSSQHPIIPLLLQHRTLSKILSTYADTLPKQVMEDGRVHGCFNQAITVTGRLSSMNPNLQNIPIRTDHGRYIRKAFVAKEGSVLLSADYSQIELRIMAHISKDTGLLTAFSNGEDVHASTAAKVGKIALSEVSADQRRQAKAVNFGLIYGMSAFGLAKQLGVDRQEAQALIDRYFQEYPGVLTYMEKIRASAQERGYVETLLGKKIMMLGAQSKQSIEKQAAIRAAINAPMQGSAAEIIKLAMLKIDQKIEKYHAKMLLQVHDELLFEVDKDQLVDFSEMVKQEMESVIDLDVDLVVNIASGNNWEDAHE